MQQRNTVQQTAVLQAVMSLANHPTADQVYDYIHGINPGLGRATVYRNLNKLAENGQLVKIRMFDSADRYDHTLRPHYHFLCENCGEFWDLDIPYMEHINTQYKNWGGRIINNHQIVFDGLCQVCQGIKKR